MARSINRLSDRAVRSEKAKGLYPDGGGLYLQVGPTGSKSWIFRYKIGGRAKDMGLGALGHVSLAEAREKAVEVRRLRGQGKDPLTERDTQRAREKLAAAHATTFRDCAERLITSHETGWRNAKHRQQWRNTMATYAYPVLGDLSIADIDTTLVLRVLEPIWASKTETASRLRGRIEAVLSWAKARGLRESENPAQWRGHLDQLLPKRSKVRAVTHHPALHYKCVPAFITKLRARNGITPRALEFTIIAASRTGETLGATFDEFDLDARVWVVPPSRMKGAKEHRVPLSQRAIEIVEEMATMRLSDFVFPGVKRGKPLSDMSLLMLLRELHPGVTTHGFRSSFKDWAAETTDFSDHVSEAALAHASADKVRQAYARGTLFAKRRELMEEWSNYCVGMRPKLKRDDFIN
jgi:integrase